MSEQENDLYNSSKYKEFKKYLNKSGLIEAMTDILANLYELEERPTDPLDYIRTHMTETIKEREELEKLKSVYHVMVNQIQEMENENINLAKAIKELELNGEDVSISKSRSITDTYNNGME